MQLFISDANIFIDLEVCGILSKMFELPYVFAVPDILYRAPLKTLNTHNGLCKCEILQEAFKS